MPIRRALALAVALALAAAPELAAEQSTFDFYISGIKVGEISLSSEKADGRYTAASRIETSGLLSTVVKFGYDGAATGKIGGDGALEPVSFVAESRSPRADRLTRIEFEDGTPVSVSVEPPRSTSPDPAAQAGTLDPVSAGFAVLRDNTPDKICNTEVDLFDGSRRSRLTLGLPVAEDARITCSGTYARIEGEAHSGMSASGREYPFRLVFRPTGEGVVTLERIETDTRFGRAVIERRS